MKYFSLPILLSSVSIGFGIGFGIAWNIPSPDYFPGNAALIGSGQAQTAQQQAGMSQFGHIWNGNNANLSSTVSASGAQPSSNGTNLATAGRLNGNTADEEKLRMLAQSNPAALQDLIRRFSSERDQNTREMLKSVLGSIQKPEVVALSSRLATSNDVEKRKEGFELLQQLPANAPEVRNVVKQALATEQSPDVLVQALAALKPAVVAPAESDAIVAQLRTLAQNPDPAVRSQSLLQLAQWDKNDSGTASLSQALADPAPQVRQAAIFAVAQSGVRSDSVKNALMGIIGNASESREVKGSALQALERFSLNQQEYASYSQARAQVGL